MKHFRIALGIASALLITATSQPTDYLQQARTYAADLCTKVTGPWKIPALVTAGTATILAAGIAKLVQRRRQDQERKALVKLVKDLFGTFDELKEAVQKQLEALEKLEKSQKIQALLAASKYPRHVLLAEIEKLKDREKKRAQEQRELMHKNHPGIAFYVHEITHPFVQWIAIAEKSLDNARNLVASQNSAADYARQWASSGEVPEWGWCENH